MPKINDKVCGSAWPFTSLSSFFFGLPRFLNVKDRSSCLPELVAISLFCEYVWYCELFSALLFTWTLCTWRTSSYIYWSSLGWLKKQPPRCSVRKVVLRNVAKFTGKHLYQSLFFDKVAGLRRTTLLKKRLLHKCFPVNFAKFLRTLFSHNTFGRLLL